MDHLLLLQHLDLLRQLLLHLLDLLLNRLDPGVQLVLKLLGFGHLSRLYGLVFAQLVLKELDPFFDAYQECVIFIFFRLGFNF